MPFVEIPYSDVDFKSPIDETLMETIKENQDFFNSSLGAGGEAPVHFKVNGSLVTLKALIDADSQNGENLDGAWVSGSRTFSRVRAFLKDVGNSGTAKIDIRSQVRVAHAITEIQKQMSKATQGVGRLGSPINTQGVTKRTPDIDTQSIARVKSQIDAASVINLGSSMRINLDTVSLLDSDWIVGAKVLLSGFTNGANDGEFTILEVNPDGHPAIVVDNGSAVDESPADGTVDLQFFEYVYTNTVDTDGFVPGEDVVMSGHTSAAMDGTFEIIRVNDNGNNILLYNDNAGADTQAGAAGTAAMQRWVYTFASAVDATIYFVGETMTASGHTDSNNDGQFEMKAINDSGNNIVVINPSGVNQAGAAGQVESDRWIYSFSTDPTGEIAAGDDVVMSGHDNVNNDGTFEVKEVGRFSLDNIVVFNSDGVEQAGANGTVDSVRTIVSFANDNSADFVANRSIVILENCLDSNNNGTFNVVEVNRGGGANFNIVILNENSVAQNDPKGQVDLESRSLFDTLPEIEVDGESPVIFGDNAVFNGAQTQTDSYIVLDVVDLPSGLPEDLSVELS